MYKPDTSDTQPAKQASITLSGTPSQIEWAEPIRLRVDSEFDRVASAFARVAAKQDPVHRAETEEIIAILNEKRSDVLGREHAGYFIQHWRDLNDQVRQLIFQDARYKAIKSRQS
jgi:hypothetical protein